MKTFDVQVDAVLVGSSYVPVEAENEEEARAKVDSNQVRDHLEQGELSVVDFQVINVEEQG